MKRVRRNLYCAVHVENREAAADRYLIGSKISESAYVTHHSAFELHGLSHQIGFVVYVASERAHDKKVLYKKAGYFFERHRESLGIKEHLLSVIEKRTGHMKKYLSEEALNGEGVLVKRWGLIVPKTMQGEDDLFV